MTDDAERLTPPAYPPQIRVIAMPSDTNPNGDIFGGWLLSQMDQAAASAAYEAAQGRCVTVAVDAMVFHHPVYVGDVVSLYARVIRRGRTSVGDFVEAWRSPREREAYEKVTEGVFTFVAIDENKRPRVLPDA